MGIQLGLPRLLRRHWKRFQSVSLGLCIFHFMYDSAIFTTSQTDDLHKSNLGALLCDIISYIISQRKTV